MTFGNPIRRSGRCLVHAALVASALGACDGTRPVKDAGAAVTLRSDQVEVRIDAPVGGWPLASVLAFRAQGGGMEADELLGAVDPLVLRPPVTHCELRQVDDLARKLRDQGSFAELEEFPGISVRFADLTVPMRPTPRVFPELARVVTGVVGEAGPAELKTIPGQLVLAGAGSGDEAVILVPSAPMVLQSDGSALVGGSIRASDDLTLTVRGGAATFIELRPFGAPLSAACPVGAGGKVTVPRDVLTALIGAAGRVPISVEAVARENRVVTSSAGATHVAVEVRISAFLDLVQ